MSEAYINKEDLLIELKAEIEFSKLVGNFDRASTLSWAVAIVETAPVLEVKRKKEEPILYRHTGERE